MRRLPRPQPVPVLLAVLLVVASVAGTVRRAEAVRGDADCNGQIAAPDLPAAIATLFEGGPCADADADGDGIRSAGDVTAEVVLLYGPSPKPAFDQVLDEVTSGGSITLDTARQMFQLAYGGLDGVDVPAGPPGTNRDGTIALRAMLQHRDDLSDADGAVFDQVVNENGPVSATVEPGSGPALAAGSVVHRTAATAADLVLPTPLPADDPTVRDFVDRLTVWLPQIADAAQILFTLPIDVVGYDVKSPQAVADTTALDANGMAVGAAPARCRIRFFQDFIDEAPEQRDNTVVHELWHCFQAQIINDVDTFNREPNWIIEGQAEYVAAKLTDTASGYFEPYLVDAGRNLFNRDYDAVGFYVTMESDGAAVFAALKAMLVMGAQSSQAAFDAAVAATPRVLDTWGEMEFEAPLFPGDWNYSVATGMPPAPDGDIPGVVHLDMGDGSSQLLTAQAHAVLLWAVDLTTDFIHFRIPGGSSGNARLLDEPGREYNDLSDLWLCQHPTPDQCQCPPGSAGEAPQSQPVLGPLKVAASAGDGGVYGVATSVSLDEICRGKMAGAADAFCADARNLQAAVSQFMPGDLDAANVQTELEIDVHWLGLMAQDAPSAIAGAMQPVAAAYVSANADLGSIGYQVVPMSEQDLVMEQAALMAITGVASQSQAVGAYVAQVCGFAFQFPGI